MLLFACAQANWSFQTLHPPGSIRSKATAVSGSGVLINAKVAAESEHAILWNDGSWLDLNPPDATDSWAYGSRQRTGGQIGASVIGGRIRAGYWSGTSSSWVSLNPPGAPYDYSLGLGWDGDQQVGYVGLGSDQHASLWQSTAQSWRDLNPLGSTMSHALSVDAGVQVGWARVSETPSHAGLWIGTPESWTDLNPNGAAYSVAYSIHGGIQAGFAYAAGYGHAGIWRGTAESWQDLNPAGITRSIAYSVFGGMQAGVAYLESGENHASVWYGTSASWVDLNSFLSRGYIGSEANSIWSDGSTIYVVGVSYNTLENRDEAVMWSAPVPELGGLSVLVPMLVAFIVRRSIGSKGD